MKMNQFLQLMPLFLLFRLLELAIEKVTPAKDDKTRWLDPVTSAAAAPADFFSPCIKKSAKPPSALKKGEFAPDQLFTPYDYCPDTRCVAYDASGSDDVGSDYVNFLSIVYWALEFSKFFT